MNASRFFLLSSLCSLCLCGESSAALDPELKTPYQLHIILHFADHPQITPAYRDRVGRDLEDSVQAALGDLGHVEVKYQHPKLRDVLKDGLQSTLDSWKERSGIKTHFVLVRYTGFDYEIQARQHDGVTGQASPFTGSVVRTERTRDRDFVARTAALLVARDFGIIGTPLGQVDSQDLIKVVLKGGGLGAPLGPWVKKDEVFGLVGIPKEGAGETVFPWLFLRVEKPPVEGANDGACVCRLYFRHINPLANPNFAGFRCVKLGTARGPVRLRLAQKNPQGTATAEPLTVYVRRLGFEGEQSSRLKLSARSDGGVDTTGENESGIFDHLAFVSINGGASESPRVPKLPVPILTDQPLDVSVPAASEGDGLFRFQRDEWTRRVNDSYLVQSNLFKRLNEMTAKPEQRKDALAEAQAGVDRCRGDYSRLLADRKELEQEIQKLPPANRPNLTAWDDRLKKMKSAEIELINYIETIKEVQRVDNDPERQKALAAIGSAHLLEEKYEYGEALKIYEDARKIKSVDSPDLQKRIARLRKDWDPRDAKHAEARTFIYDTWPKLDTPGLKAKMEDATKAFAECKRVGDRLGPLKMIDVMLAHGERMKRELTTLKPNLNEEDEKKAKLIEDVTVELGKLETEVNAFLKTTAPK